MPQTRLITMKADDLGGNSQGLRDALGQPLEGATITFTLVDNQGRAVEMVDRATGQDVVGAASVTTDSAGEMSIGLWANTRSDLQSWWFVRIDATGYRDFLAWIDESGDVLPWNEFRGSSGGPVGTFREGHIVRRGTSPDPAPQDMPQRGTLQFDGFDVTDDEQNDKTIVTNTSGDGGLGGELGKDIVSAGNKFLVSDKLASDGGVVSGAWWDDAGTAELTGSKGAPGTVGDEEPIKVGGSTVTISGETGTSLPVRQGSKPGYRLLHQGAGATIGSEKPDGLFYGTAENVQDIPIHTGTGIGPWVIVTGANVALDQNVAVDTLRIYAEGMIAETGGANGALEFGISTSDQATPSAALDSIPVIAGNTVLGGIAVIAAAAFTDADTIYLWARGNAATDAAFNLSLLGVLSETGIGLYIPGASGGGLPGDGNLKSDGSVPMDVGYAPAADQDIVTKKYHDDNSGGAPGGDGIIEPDVPPVAAGVAVAYASTAGDKAANPDTDLQTPTNVLKQGTHRVTSNGTVYEIETAAGGGTTIHIKPGDGGASLQIIVPAGAGPQDPIFIQSVAASLEIVSDSAIFIQDMQWPAAGSGVPGGYLIATTETTLGFSQGSSQGSAVSPDPIYGGFLGQSA